MTNPQDVIEFGLFDHGVVGKNDARWSRIVLLQTLALSVCVNIERSPRFFNFY